MTNKRRGEVRAVSAAELQRALREPRNAGGERRSDRRVPAKLSVELRVSRDDLRSIYTENISNGGLLFSIAPPVTLPGTVEITVQLPDGESVELTGDVRHVESRQSLRYVGIQFTSISDDVRRKFENALTEMEHN